MNHVHWFCSKRTFSKLVENEVLNPFLKQENERPVSLRAGLQTISGVQKSLP